MSHPTHAVPRSPWLPMAGLVGVYSSFGLAIGIMPPLVDEIMADLALTRATMGSILGAWAFIYIFTAIPAGALVDRIGLRRAVALGGVSIAASLLLRGVAGGAVSLFAAVAVFGIGGPLVSISAPKLVATLFAEQARRLPTGIAVSASGIGASFGLALADPVLMPAADDRWRVVLTGAAAVAIVVTVLWWWSSLSLAEHSGDSSGPFVDRVAMARLARLPSMRWVLWLSLFTFAFSHGYGSWLPEILVDRGQSENAAGLLAALSVAASIVGSFVIARVVPDRRRPQVLAAVFGVIMVVVIGLNLTATTALAAVVVGIGFIRAGAIPLMFLEVMNDDEISLGDIGMATGMFFAVAEIGGFASPWLMGILAGGDRGFAGATMFLAAVSGLGLIGAAGLARLRAGQSRGSTGSLSSARTPNTH